MVDATSRIKHLVNELVITNDSHSVTAFRGYQVGCQPIVIQIIVIIEPWFNADEIATVDHTHPAIAQIFDSAITMQMRGVSPQVIDSRIICLAALDKTIKPTVRSALLPLFSIHKSTQLTDSRNVSSESLLLDPGTVCKRTKQALFGKRLPLITKLDAQLSHGFHPVELSNSI
ncbi:hypothetical protein ALO70_200079 [Pseudomonas amygdali pv. eriobotryae]|nr:hypothetical protein ALO70_200079 [Pseudomonas amygdali pv. eriobotryae]